MSVVIVHFHQPDALRATLKALSEQTLRPYRTTVVDNGDGSDCAELVREYGAELLIMNQNAGFAAAVNSGVTHLSPGVDAVLIMSHECQLAPESLERMFATMEEDPSIGAVGPLLGYIDKPDRVWSAGGSFGRRRRRPFHLLSGNDLLEVTPPAVIDVGWLDGACLLVRFQAAQSIGPMREWWFLYVEEVEWLSRMPAAGWRVVCDRGAVAWQEPGMTPPYLEARNLARWFAQRGQILPLLLFLGDQVWTALKALVTGSPWEARARTLGVCHALTGRLDVGQAGRRRSTKSR